MKIEGRKDKPYSERLYGELYILALLIEAEGNLPSYLFHDRLNKSQRTYRRYFEELHDAGLIPPYSSRRVKSPDKPLDKDWMYSVDYGLQDFVKSHKGWFYYPRELLLDFLYDYSLEQINPQDRLYRLGRILICSMYDCYYDSEFDSFHTRREIDEYIRELNMSEYVIEDGEYYHIVINEDEDLYQNLSPRSRQRDLKLLRKVILDVLKQHDRF